MPISTTALAFINAELTPITDDEGREHIDSMLKEDFHNSQATLVDLEDMASWEDNLHAVRGFGEIDCYSSHEQFHFIVYTNKANKTIVFKSETNCFYAPILKQVQVIITDDSRYAVSDWQVTNWYRNLLTTQNPIANVATMGMFNELRVGVRLGEIKPFSFVFEGREYQIGSKGELTPEWAINFFDQQATHMYSLMSGCSREDALKKLIDKKTERQQIQH